MWALWLMRQFPILWIVVGLVVGANNYFVFDAGTAMGGIQGILIPVLFIVIGIAFIAYNKMSQK